MKNRGCQSLREAWEDWNAGTELQPGELRCVICSQRAKVWFTNPNAEDVTYADNPQCTVRVFRDLLLFILNRRVFFAAPSNQTLVLPLGNLLLGNLAQAGLLVFNCRRCIASSGCSCVREITFACNCTPAMSSDQE